MKGAIGYVKLTFLFRQEGHRIVGFCKELGTAGYGNDLHEAIECLEDLVTLHLNALEETGERSRFFKERSITIYRAKPAIQRLSLPKLKEDETIRPHIQPIHVHA